ncbi:MULTISPECIES: dTDP-4-dehydrorhamnose 3,5-epimerase family protein [unclassified Streptomyces]|uniref:dTDP-4-dehydrorhamnose 3,5-epimerase family protein n=1 Tax=unclassified Streptomyces TaxID=2593676 RepID=UPI002E7AAC54|nr:MULTISPECIES: dTDP-4-dehydrorhamnose 3,5-epimerase family protein [unclassified Streptomyces]MEE1758244.1 dTDP-4-dehydrorhamnose 3,5-epimerase family protein [Streptomyces sp. SP18BB07]MEE1832700.1 dTDP-4-dehydrorhamnose 3,5-epimerase family protein [Streptomyces sp. SP17KL33]
MDARRLKVEGAVEFTPRVYPDDRGLFLSPFQEEAFTEAVGHGFPLAQFSHSTSRRGAVRGIHFTSTPPGMAKYAYCPRGRALDIVVDLRTGSPTFGVWDAVLLDQEDFRAVYYPLGVGHAFVALEDDTVVSYLLSTGYVAEREHAVSVLDPALGLPIPDGIEPVLSERDRLAPTLEEAAARGLLPDYTVCQETEAARWV